MPPKNKPAKESASIDLSEYAEEAVPFDAVIRQLAKAKPAHRVAPKPKPAKPARQRK
jgi:hypothetical protein